MKHFYTFGATCFASKSIGSTHKMYFDLSFSPEMIGSYRSISWFGNPSMWLLHREFNIIDIISAIVSFGIRPCWQIFLFLFLLIIDANLGPPRVISPPPPGLFFLFSHITRTRARALKSTEMLGVFLNFSLAFFPGHNFFSLKCFFCGGSSHLVESNLIDYPHQNLHHLLPLMTIFTHLHSPILPLDIILTLQDWRVSYVPVTRCFIIIIPPNNGQHWIFSNSLIVHLLLLISSLVFLEHSLLLDKYYYFKYGWIPHLTKCFANWRHD